MKTEKYISFLLILKTLLISAALSIALSSCSSNIRQFYPDYFYDEDNIYENKAIHFTIVYKGKWILFTDPSQMDKSNRVFARSLNKRGAELLFIGTTAEGMYGTRGIAINLNEPAREYAQHVRDLNKSDIEDDSGLVDFYVGTFPMVKWIYSKSNFRFVEFFFNAGTYDLRISFWCKKESFDNFLPVFEEIITSISFSHGL